jgi:exonuclease SbcC
MKLKKIVLNNIRSYENQEVSFSDGSTLLSGDIGSGKTSVLLGIEFALFGLQPGQRGSSLLRNGANNGGVLMEFEVDDKKIVIERSLKKGKTITQDYCSIDIDGEKAEPSVSELKDKVLSLLSYPKEFAKKQNILYKFTVYTPQEEMKQIILEDPETRINTLRHVFGIDKYKKVLENVETLTVKLREEKRIKQALTANAEQDKLFLISKEEELETKQYNLTSLEKELFLKTEKRKEVQEGKDQIALKIEEKTKLEQEIEKTKIMVANKKDLISGNVKLIMQIEDQIGELASLKFDETKIPLLEKDKETKKKEKTEFTEKSIEISSKINSLNLKNKENDLHKERIKHIEICPTCLQDVDSNYKANIVNKLDSDISENVKKIEELNIEKIKLSETLNKIDYEISMVDKEIQDLKILKIRFQEFKDKEKRIKELKTSNFVLEKDIKLLMQHLDILKDSVFDLKKFDTLYEQKQKELDLALKEERIAEIKVAEIKKEIEVFSRHIQELKEKIKKLQEIQKQLEHVTELESWLSKKFFPLIEFIERNVMVKLKAEFSKLFQEWFSILVSENFNAKLDDNFTPIIEQHDYEIDYAYLSGGERTAVALAYRLSLNQVINSFLSKIKTRNLVILDEPTDGFSEQQLDKMREVLEELNVKQLIIVSHEQKMEGFVENIIRFKKEDGFTKVYG